MQNRLLKEDDGNENRALHRCLGEFYLDHSSLKQFSSTRVPFHFEHAQMYKEMIHFLRGTASRNVYPIDRRAYLQVNALFFINTQINYPTRLSSNVI